MGDNLGSIHGYNAFVFALMAIVISTSLDTEYNVKNGFIRYCIICTILFLTFYAIIAGIEDFLNQQVINRGIDTPIYIVFNVLYNGIFFIPFIIMWSILITVYLYRRSIRY